MNFVVVDNNKSDLDLLVKTIVAAMPGCQVQPFTDPLLSAKYICNNATDVALLAAEMAPVDGYILLRVLRKNKPELPVVLLSNRELNGIDAIYAGASGHLIKPVSSKDFSSIMHEMLL